MAKKLTKAEQISRIAPEDIAKLGGEEGIKKLRGYVRSLRSAYKRRVGSFKRNNVVSYAQIAFENSLIGNKQVQLTKMSRNQLLLEFFRYSSFFNAETSSVEGVKRVNREQDKRIFGQDNRGKPTRNMTNSQRRLYWKLYDEYKKQNPGKLNQVYSSEFIQQLNAEALFGGGSLFDILDLPDDFDADEVFSNMDVVGFISSLDQSLMEGKIREDLRDVPNILSGRRSDF